MQRKINQHCEKKETTNFELLLSSLAIKVQKTVSNISAQNNAISHLLSLHRDL